MYLQLQKDVFFPNDLLVGNVLLNIKKPLPRSRIYLQFKGYEIGGQPQVATSYLNQLIKSGTVPDRRASIAVPRFTSHQHYPQATPEPRPSLVPPPALSELTNSNNHSLLPPKSIDVELSRIDELPPKREFNKSQTVKSISSSKQFDLRKFQKSETLPMKEEFKNMRTLGNANHHKVASIFRAEKRLRKHSNKLILLDFKLPVF